VLHRPDILFLDEPTLGLDPGQRRRIWEFLKRLSSESGTTLFLTTHYLEEADPCDRVAIVDHGKIVASGEPATLKRGLGRERIELKTDRPEAFVDQIREMTDAEPLLHMLMPLTKEGLELGVSLPSLEDVFVDLTGRKSEVAAL
jgi:ABC-2 type transport system ATP-binding protein